GAPWRARPTPAASVGRFGADAPFCYPERSEGPAFQTWQKQVLHCVQDDEIGGLIGWIERFESDRYVFRRIQKLPGFGLRSRQDGKASLSTSGCVSLMWKPDQSTSNALLKVRNACSRYCSVQNQWRSKTHCFGYS